MHTTWATCKITAGAHTLTHIWTLQTADRLSSATVFLKQQCTCLKENFPKHWLAFIYFFVFLAKRHVSQVPVNIISGCFFYYYFLFFTVAKQPSNKAAKMWFLPALYWWGRKSCRIKWLPCITSTDFAQGWQRLCWGPRVSPPPPPLLLHHIAAFISIQHAACSSHTLFIITRRTTSCNSLITSVTCISALVVPSLHTCTVCAPWYQLPAPYYEGN